MLTIYKASAGSGKTYTLAYQYIKMLLGVKLENGSYVLNDKKYLGNRPLKKRAHSHILAITFTNKATAEMKSRIISELDKLGYIPLQGESDSPYAADLMAEYGCSREELASVADRSLQALLRDYGAFNISTIDAFFQVILRTFAREIDRQGDYRLEIDNTYAISSATSMLFDDVNDRNSDISNVASDWMKEIAFKRMNDGRDFNPFNRNGDMYRSVLNILAKSFDDFFERNADRVHEYICDADKIKAFVARLDELSDQYIKDEVKAAQTFLSALAKEGLSDSNMYNYLRKFFMASITNPGLGDAQMKNYTKSQPPKYIEALVEHDKTVMNLFTRGVDPSQNVYDALFSWADIAFESMFRRKIYAELKSSITTLRALAFINDYIIKFRLENNLILIDDTNSLLSSIICESDTPFIYERVGVELQNFLIDEFQDTSKQQWRNLKPLLANSLSEQHDSLIIGDVKQSIYRFRNADSDLLDHVVEMDDFPRQHVTKGAGPGENTNYRSAHGIVSFNNTLFKRLAGHIEVTGYEGVAQSLPKKTEDLTSYICIKNFVSDDFESFKRYITPDELQNIPTLDLRVNRAVSLFLTGREILSQHERGYSWRDIAILTRKNSDAQVIAEYFMRVFPEIKLASEEALLLRNSKAVKLIISILEIIDKSYISDSLQVDINDKSRSAIARRRAMMIDRFEYLVAHGEDSGVALEKALNFSEEVSVNADNKTTSIADDINELRAMAPANLSALVEAIIDKKIPMEQRREERAYLDAFLDVVLDFSNNYIPTVHTFLNFWNQKKGRLSIAESSGQDAVMIMTIHKAKGLEWDCVHIPLMDWNVESDYDEQWFALDRLVEVNEEIRPPLMYLKGSAALSSKYSPISEELALQFNKGLLDNINAAYVAFTRSVRELHITMCAALKSSSELKLYTVLPELLKGEVTAVDPMYMDTKVYIDEFSNFEYGSPTYPVKAVSDGVQKKQRHPVIPGSVKTLDMHIEFSELNAPISQVEDLVAKSSELFDPNIGNDRTTDPVDEYDPADDKMRQAALRGIKLHNILADTISLYDLEDSIIRNSRGSTTEDIDDYRSTLSDAIANAGEYGELWFDIDAPRILTEAPIYMPKISANYRVDRIVWTREGTIDIIDYKFTAQMHEEHKTQVSDYAKLLIAMGYQNIRKFVWYPLKDKIIEVY